MLEFGVWKKSTTTEISSEESSVREVFNLLFHGSRLQLQVSLWSDQNSQP